MLPSKINSGGRDPIADEDSTASFSTRLTTPSCSGIHALPDELISLIMIAVVTPRPRSMWTGFDEPDLFDSNIAHFPVVAQLVCRRWAEIALLTPGLWTTVNITSESEYTLDGYFDRSGILPLEVYFGPPPLHKEYTSTDLYNNISELHQHRHRIQRMHILRRNAAMSFHRLEPRLSDFENLLELTMESAHTPENPHPPDRAEWYPMMLKAPRLRSLRLYKYTFTREAEIVFTDLEELRVVGKGGPASYGSGLPGRNFVDALKGCPNLRALELGQQPLKEQPSTQDETTSTTYTVILGELEQLTLWGYTNGQLRLFLDLIQAPKLRALIIRKHVGSTFRPAVGPLVVGFPVLRRLEIDAGSDLYLSIAEQVPTIKHLRFLHDHKGITLEDVDNRFNSLASHWRTLSCAMPLETLETRGVRVSSLLSLLGEDRLKILPSLQKVTVNYKDASSLGDVGGSQSQGAELKRLAGLVTTSVRGLRTTKNGVHPLEGVDKSIRLESWRANLHQATVPSECREWRRKGYYLEKPIDKPPSWVESL